MKRTRITFLFVLLMSMTSYDAIAHDIAVENNDGVTIFYNYTANNTKLQVTKGSYYYSGNVVIPSSVTYDETTYPVTSISTDAFRNSFVTSVSIPNSVDGIPSFAFQNCSNLESINIPNGATTIYNNTFQGCTKLETINIPNTVTLIGPSAFKNCSSLTNLSIPNSVVYIRNNAFNGCTSLYSLSLPSSVTTIDESAFEGCTGLTSVSIPSSVMSIGQCAFSGCTDLETVFFPNSSTSIGNYAFEECTSLTSITITNPEASIGSYAFTGCTNLANINIPSSMTNIGGSAFDGTAWYNNQPNGVVYLNKVAYGYKGTMPSNTSITINYGVLAILEHAFFYKSNLTSIILPSTLTSIGESAFSGCTGLTSVTVKRKTPITISSNVFSNIANATLYVPSVAAYEEADVWKDFKEIKESIESYTLSSVGMGTYCSEYDLDFTNVSGIKAYIASGFNPTTGIVFVMHVNEVPANTGILIKGTPGTYSIPVMNSDMYYANMFKGTLTAITVPATEDGYKNYVLASDQLFHGSLGGSTLTANRAYLQIPLSVVGGNSNAPEFIVLEEDNVTGIVAPENTKHMDEGETYNLNGQRVVSPKKGLYIRNGKKVIIN